MFWNNTKHIQSVGVINTYYNSTNKYRFISLKNIYWIFQGILMSFVYDSFTNIFQEALVIYFVCVRDLNISRAGQDSLLMKRRNLQSFTWTGK